MIFTYIRAPLFLSLLLPTVAFAGVRPPIVLKHEGWVAAVAFSPDGKTLASAGADNVVRLWDVGSWKPAGVLKGHTDCVSAVAFSSDSKLLATGSFDRSARLWDVEKRVAKETFTDHEGAVLSVLIFKKSTDLVTGGVDAAIIVNSTSSRLTFRGHKSWVNSLARDRDDTVWASGSSDGTVRLYNYPTILLEGGAGEVRSVAFSPDGKLLAAGNRYGTVRVWNVGTRKEVKTLTGHASDVWAVAFSPDGKTLAAADTDWKKPSKVKLWDTTTWKERGSLACPGEILCLAYSPNGDWLAVGSWDRTVRLFSLGR